MLKKKKELTQDEMDYILGGAEIQLNGIAGATNDNINTIATCTCPYDNSSRARNLNKEYACTCVCR